MTTGSRIGIAKHKEKDPWSHIKSVLHLFFPNMPETPLRNRGVT